MKSTIRGNRCPSSRLSATRRGSLIIEVVISAALFATAVIALGRLSQTTAKLGIQADQRLSAKLTAENVLQHLHQSAADSLDESIAEVETSASATSGFRVKITSDEFQFAGRDATHFVVEIRDSKSEHGLKVVVQDWRLSDEKSEASQ